VLLPAVREYGEAVRVVADIVHNVEVPVHAETDYSADALSKILTVYSVTVRPPLSNDELQSTTMSVPLTVVVGALTLVGATAAYIDVTEE
jgi:hypothetical protein